MGFHWLFKASVLALSGLSQLLGFPSFNHVEVINPYSPSNPEAGKVQHSLHLQKYHPIHLPLIPPLITNSLLLLIQTFKALIANLNSLPVASTLMLSKLERTSALSSAVVTAVPQIKSAARLHAAIGREAPHRGLVSIKISRQSSWTCCSRHGGRLMRCVG
jgi:hypothetical protein